MQGLVDLLEHLGAPRVALVGDYMLDRYVTGEVERISPEAPIPIVKVLRQAESPGGAGSVASAILALGGKVACIGAAGQDAAGEQLNRLLMSSGAETAGLVRIGEIATTVKTRYVGLAQHRNQQQMLRVDREHGGAVPEVVQATLRTALLGQLRGCDILAIQDHDKGALSEGNTAQLIADAAAAGVRAIVDPARIGDYGRYEGAAVLAPNRWEAQAASGVEIRDDASLSAAAWRIVDVTGAEAVVISLDREGLYLLERDGAGRRVPTRPRDAYDGTGAGDEVLAALAVALAAGWAYADAAALANVAGGLEVERFGVVPIRRREIVEELRRRLGLRGGKVLGRQPLAAEVARRRRRGGLIVFTNGCFDLLHAGHVRYLQQAREMGSCLIVAINADDSARRLKGPARPVIGQQERAEMLAALECVDYVTVFDEDTPEALLELLKPDLLVKGGTTGEVVGRQLVEGYGGKVRKLPAVEGLSTTGLIDRIVDGRGA
jgi:D-beta-D-heptose 7-phosphate kinase/D-beta-D-heptose 1-phosphate adenosyltransferase